MAALSRVVLLSDLHLGDGGRGELFHRDEQLCSFLARLRADADVGNVVLLGDTFDLVEGEATPGADATTRAVARLGHVAAAHRDVVAGLAGLLQAGKDVTVVRGNHDVDLARPQVWERLAWLLGSGSPRDGGRLVSTPWLLHLPGLLLAEHGHQHHDINRFDKQLWPFAHGPSGPAEEPFAAALSRLLHTTSGPRLRLKALGAALRHGVGMQSPQRRRRRADYRRSVLPEMISGLDLPLSTAQQLDALSERNTVQVLARIATKRADRRRPAHAYLPKAAHTVLRTLGPLTPPYLIYGHSHAADAVALRSRGVSSTYLNTGTWSRRGPRPGESTLTTATATWVEVDDGPGHPARIFCWTDGEPRLLAEVVDGRVTRDGRASSRP